MLASAYLEQPGVVGAQDLRAGASCGAAGLGWEAQGGSGFSGQKRAFGGLKPDGRKKEMPLTVIFTDLTPGEPGLLGEHDLVQILGVSA